jgi:hypothetical protein
MLMIGWRLWARCSPQLSVMTGRRSYLLPDDSRVQQEHGGMPTLPLMLRQTPSPGRSSLRASGTTTYLQDWWGWRKRSSSLFNRGKVSDRVPGQVHRAVSLCTGWGGRWPKEPGALHGGIGWTASVPADVSHFSVFPAPVRQGHHPGGHAHRIERSEEERHYFCAVWEQHSSPFHSTVGNNTPCWRFRW